MKQMINTTDYAFDVERYRDEADAISFAGNLGMDLNCCRVREEEMISLQNDPWLAYICDILIPGWISGMENWRC